MPIKVLIIEDEKLIRWSLNQHLSAEGYTVHEADTGAAGLERLREQTFDLIMLDYRLPDMTGLDVLRQIRDIDGDVVVIMMTAYSSVESAVEAMRLGAFDYVTKPFKMEELLLQVRKGLETTKLKREVRDLRERLQHEFGFDRIIGRHPSMLELFATIREVALSNATTIFLRGESGTGKDLVARVIHHNSHRAHRPFMNITCTAISETLLESELFGHERGAFTDAKTQKKGLFELADGGTVFLDEVGDMPASLQAKLLRFLEEKTFRRVGGTQDITVDVRIIAATNRDVEKAMAEGRFREDLFYRLNVVPIYLPPLRDRGEDIDLLTHHFVAMFAKEFRKPVRDVSPEALELLRSYSWPGNIRELRNAIERAVLLSKGEVLTPEDFVLGPQGRQEEPGGLEGLRLPPGGVNLARVEEQLVRQAMQRCGNNQTQAAKLLGISRDQLRYRLEKFGLL